MPYYSTPTKFIPDEEGSSPLLTCQSGLLSSNHFCPQNYHTIATSFGRTHDECQINNTHQYANSDNLVKIGLIHSEISGGICRFFSNFCTGTQMSHGSSRLLDRSLPNLYTM